VSLASGPVGAKDTIRIAALHTPTVDIVTTQPAGRPVNLASGPVGAKDTIRIAALQTPTEAKGLAQLLIQ
jgi:hypothetical protein